MGVLEKVLEFFVSKGVGNPVLMRTFWDEWHSFYRPSLSVLHYKSHRIMKQKWSRENFVREQTAI